MRARHLLLVALVGCSCHASSAPQGRPAGQGSAATTAGLSSAGAPSATPDAGAPAALDTGMPRLSVVLDDPRLSAARERERAHDGLAAAKAVEAAQGSATLDPATACAWTYVTGRLYALAGEHALAAAAFDRAAASGADACALAPYASLRAAEALERAGRHDEAIAHARAVGDTVAARDEGRLALADALVGKGDRAGAVAIWRALLAASPRGLRWADSSMQLATTLLDGVDGPAEAHAREALDLATRVVVESPAAAEKADTAALRARAARALHLADAPALTFEERARLAQAWADGSQPRRATEAADALLKALGKAGKGDRHAEAACKAATVRAQAVPRSRSSAAADAWGVAIERCDGADALATALYYGAKASASAHRLDEALARFGRVERDFPRHRLADDARLRAAQIVLDQGDAARYGAMLGSVPDAYPDGDMAGEALFRLALDRIGARDLPAATAALDRALTLPSSDDRASGTTGRAAYFRARVAEMAGQTADARERYGALVAAQPLSFYMLLAYRRLRAADPAAARATLDLAATHEAPAPFLSREHALLSSAPFARFARLLEVGELDAARREASAGGLTAEGVDPEVLWTVAWCYDRAGAPDLGHAFARGRLVDYRSHWPAGRWRLPWQVAFPRAWPEVVTSESAAAGVPAPLTWSIMREESAFNAEARSGASAIGLMQLLVGTAKQMAQGTSIAVDEASLKRPEVSIALGSRLLASFRTAFAPNPSLAIAAYNSGSSPVRRWLSERGGDDFDLFVERIPYEETRNYLKRVLTSEAAYAYLYAPAAIEELLALPERAAGQ